MTTPKSITCRICGYKRARERRVTRSYGHGNDLLVVESVPVICCARCGESYLTAETLHELEQIKRGRRRAGKRAVAFARFG
jgi:YgiT-type zinc finger domain-containing protein